MEEAVPSAIIRPGLLDRLKENSGIRTDEAFAAAIGVSTPTLYRVRAGDEPSLRFVVGVAQAFGLGLGEVAIPVTEHDQAESQKTAS